MILAKLLTQRLIFDIISLMLPISYTDDSVAVVYLARQEEKYAVLSSSRMKLLLDTIDHLKAVKNLKGVIITGPNPKVFCLGADISEIDNISTFEHAFQASQNGQEIFKALASLPCPVVAAISGTCVGGGLELCLFCDWRVATTGSVLGLPEVKLGIIPGFGGTQTLPRIVGLRNALDLILKGRLIRANEALELGLVDEVSSEAELEQSALKFVAKGKRTRLPSIWFIPGLASVYAWLAEKQLAKRVEKRHYPAPFAAIQAIKAGFSLSVDGFSIESEQLAKCLTSETSKNLIYLWKIGDELKKIGKNYDSVVNDYRRVGVCGCGVMGRGIALLLANKGFERVVVYEESEQVLEQAKQVFQSAPNVKLTNDIKDLVDCSCVIEAIWENEEAKKALFKQLSEVLPSTALICTNTSSIPITRLSEAVLLPQRFLGLHFFNPAQKMPLVEVIRGLNTDDKYVLITVALANKLGKTPVIVEDCPGFLVNRMLARYFAAAVDLFFEGYNVQEIDRVMQNFGFPMGPFKVLDNIGLDVAFSVGQLLEKSYGEKFKLNEKIQAFLDQKYLGIKSNKGFYDYSNPKKDQISSLAKSFLDPRKKVTADFHLRLLLPLVDEAYECWNSEVAGKKGMESQAQIDIASVFGFGFPAFLGGVLKWAHSEKFLGEVKASNVSEQLKQYPTLHDNLAV